MYILYCRQVWSACLNTHANTQTHTTRYVQAEWAAAWGELTRERGLWGPASPAPLDKWALDSTEGPSRMRKTLRRNHLFYVHYPYRPNLQNSDIVCINYNKYNLINVLLHTLRLIY